MAKKQRIDLNLVGASNPEIAQIPYSTARIYFFSWFVLFILSIIFIFISLWGFIIAIIAASSSDGERGDIFRAIGFSIEMFLFLCFTIISGVKSLKYKMLVSYYKEKISSENIAVLNEIERKLERNEQLTTEEYKLKTKIDKKQAKREKRLEKQHDKYVQQNQIKSQEVENKTENNAKKNANSKTNVKTDNEPTNDQSKKSNAKSSKK